MLAFGQHSCGLKFSSSLLYRRIFLNTKELKLILQNAILRHYKMPPKPDGSLVQSILSSSALAANEGLSKILKIEKICLKVFLLEINLLYGTYLF